MESKGKQLLLGLIGVPIIILLLIPFETTIVPVWRIRVVDENGKPYESKRVREVWKHYSLDRSPGTNVEDQWTDVNGYVTFPERTIKANLLKRMAYTSLANISKLAHGSAGARAYILVPGLSPIDYERDKPLPEQIIIPRDKSQ